MLAPRPGSPAAQRAPSRSRTLDASRRQPPTAAVSRRRSRASRGSGRRGGPSASATRPCRRSLPALEATLRTASPRCRAVLPGRSRTRRHGSSPKPARSGPSACSATGNAVDDDSEATEALARLAVERHRCAGLCMGLSRLRRGFARGRGHLPDGQCASVGTARSGQRRAVVRRRARGEKQARRSRPRRRHVPRRRSGGPRSGMGPGDGANDRRRRRRRTGWSSARGSQRSRPSATSRSISRACRTHPGIAKRAHSPTRTDAIPARRSRRFSPIDRRRCWRGPVGIGLGKRLDWPAARLAEAELERDAAYGLELREAPQPGEPPRCADVRRDLSRFIEIGRLGEVEALRRRVAATGEPIDALAAESRRVTRSMEETPAAQPAASAAFAATAASPYSSAPPPAR